MNKHCCIVCEGRRIGKLYDGILICKECSFVFADADLSDDELQKLYSRSYFLGEEYSDYLADKKTLQKNFMLRLKVLKQFIDRSRHRRLLEIGCAYGFFLELVQDLFDHVVGIDISEEGTRFAREELNLNALHAEFLQHSFNEQEFDVVCLWDTIEHLPMPHLYLEKISDITDTGSLVALTTGDIGSLNARLKKDSWRLIHPPTHLHYFSKKTLEQLLNKYGFEIIYSRYCGFYRSLNNMVFNLFVLRKNWPWMNKLLSCVKIGHFDFYLNLYDIRYVIARKR